MYESGSFCAAGVMRAREDIAEFLRWKKLYYVNLRAAAWELMIVCTVWGFQPFRSQLNVSYRTKWRRNAFASHANSSAAETHPLSSAGSGTYSKSFFFCGRLTDKATFSRSGMFNTHNFHLSVCHNPYIPIPHACQEILFIKVWVVFVTTTW